MNRSSFNKGARAKEAFIGKIGLAALIGLMSIASNPSVAELSPPSAPSASSGASQGVGESDWTGTLTIGFGGIGSSDVGDSGAAYDLNWGSIEFGLGPLASSLKLMNYDWDGSDQLLGGADRRDPWGSLYELNIGWTHGGVISDRAVYEVTVGAISAFEKQMSGSYTGYAAAYAIYALESRWTLAAGALYSKHTKVSTQFDFVPIAGIMWNQQATSGLSFAIGFPSTDVTWRFSPKTSIRLELSTIEGGVYRLADNSTVEQEGFVEFRSTTATLRFDTETRNGIGLHFGASQALDRELRLYDSEGGNRTKHAIEKDIGFFAYLSWGFGS